MKRVYFTLKGLLVLGIMLCFIGVDSVSATRAITQRDTGCYVRVGTGDSDYEFDSACTYQAVLKMDDDGEFDFYVYQDHGQLPEGSWRPEQPYRNSFEACYNFSFGPVCGIVKESVSPSGQYKSSFKSY
jgi:hypothetical protein